jgi:hypothetical protein
MKPSDRRQGWECGPAPMGEPATVTVSTGTTAQKGTLFPALALIGVILLSAVFWSTFRHGMTFVPASTPVQVSPSMVRAGSPKTVVMDQWWSSDFAVEAARMNCVNEAGPGCDSEHRGKAAREEEAQFTTEFSTTFQADHTCFGHHFVWFWRSVQK